MFKKFSLSFVLLTVMALGVSQYLVASGGPVFGSSCGGCCPATIGSDSNYACEQVGGGVNCYYINTKNYSSYTAWFPCN